MKYTCTLTIEPNNCPNLEDGKRCKGNTQCCFCIEVIEAIKETPATQKNYVRKERWYEKYYQKP